MEAELAKFVAEGGQWALELYGDALEQTQDPDKALAAARRSYNLQPVRPEKDNVWRIVDEAISGEKAEEKPKEKGVRVPKVNPSPFHKSLNHAVKKFVRGRDRAGHEFCTNDGVRVPCGPKEQTQPRQPGQQQESTPKNGANDEAWLKDLDTLVNRMIEDVQAADLSDQQKADYLRTMRKAMKNMPTNALRRIGKSLNGVSFYPDLDSLSNGVRSDVASAAFGPIHKLVVKYVLKALGKYNGIAGFYNGHSMKVHVDGGPKHWRTQVYAHELTHAIDGRTFELSKSAAWKKAWAADIKGGALTQYATTSPAEGFAEFGMIMYAYDDKPKDMEDIFPNAAAFFKERGLWPNQ